MSNERGREDVKPGGRFPSWVKDIENYILQGLRQKILSRDLKIHAAGLLHGFVYDPIDGGRSSDSDSEQLSPTTSVARVLLGSKGTGKTVCLVWKAALVSQKTDLLQIPSSHPYHCRLGARTIVIDVDEKSPFLEHATWHALWKVALILLYLARIEAAPDTATGRGNDADDKFDHVERSLLALAREVVKADKVNYRADPVSPLVGAIIAANWNRRDYTRLYTKAFARLTDPNIVRDSRPVVLIMDSLDEALSESAVEAKLSEHGRTLWQAAQSGLIDAIYELQSATSGQFLCYAGLRQEVRPFYSKHGTKSISQLDEEFLLQLLDQYDHASMLDIFEINVDRMSEDREPLFKGGTAIEQFFGTDMYPHLFVYGESESPLDWLLRHTFGRPRELVWHGQRLSAAFKELRRDQPQASIPRSKASRAINEIALSIYEDYRDKMVPNWDSTVERGLGLFERNTLTADERVAIDATFRTLCGPGASTELASDGLVTYLYRRGFIGYPKPVGADEQRTGVGHQFPFKQVFEAPGTLTMKEALPVANYFVLHPCFSEAVLRHDRAKKEANFFTTRFVVGSGLGCPEDFPAALVELRPGAYSSLLEVWVRPRLQGTELLPFEQLLDETESDSRTLIVCTLAAMFRFHAQYVSRTQLSQVALELRRDKLVSPFMGRLELRDRQAEEGGQTLDNVFDGNTDQYIRTALNYPSGSVPGAVRNLPRGQLNKYGLSFESPLARGDRIFGIRGVRPSEIDFLR